MLPEGGRAVQVLLFATKGELFTKLFLSPFLSVLDKYLESSFYSFT
jgi:hypothetical protein